MGRGPEQTLGWHCNCSHSAVRAATSTTSLQSLRGNCSQAARNYCMWVGVGCDRVNGSVNSIKLAGYGFAGSIPTQLFTLSTLTYLNFGNNQLGSSIPTAMGLLSSLKALYLSVNQLSGVVPSALCQNKNLLHLSVHSNARLTCYAECLATVPHLTADVGACAGKLWRWLIF